MNSFSNFQNFFHSSSTIVVILLITSHIVLSNSITSKSIDLATLPLAPSTPSSIPAKSGFITTPNDAQLFYLFIPKLGSSQTSIDPNIPILVWLNGGPGCSSLIGMFMEIGPLRFKPSKGPSTTQPSLVDNSMYSYTQYYHVLLIDNPSGAGYSFPASKSPDTAMNVGSQFLLFAMQQFYNQYPQYVKNPLYLFGESYGGKYVIAMANAITQYNEKKLANQVTIPLQGIAMGNAWIAPDIQERTYGELAYIVGLSDYTGLIRVNSKQHQCHEFVEQQMYKKTGTGSGVCQSALNEMLRNAGGVNVYDYRLFGTYSALGQLETYLKRDDVKQVLLGVSSIDLAKTYHYEQCSIDIWDKFRVDFQQSYLSQLVPLLSKYKVLIYNGQFDLRCPVYGTNEYLRYMDWYGRFNFNYEPHYPIYMTNSNVNDPQKAIGIFRKYDNLTQVVLYNSGHISPHDIPQASLEMVRRFLDNKSFCSYSIAYNATGGGMCTGTSITTPQNSMTSDTLLTQCPNLCSGHGQCNVATVPATCQCSPGFYEQDCSTAKHDITFGMEATYRKNIIFGNTIHLYHLTMPYNDLSNGLFDIHVKLTKTSKLGKLHIYAYTSNETFVENSQIDESNIEDMRRRFPFHDLEDVNEKSLNMNELFRNRTRYITILLINTVDTESMYDLVIESDVSGKKLNPYLVTSIAIFSFLCITIIVLFLIYVVQYFNDQRILRSMKYEMAQ
ncbi:hypothetical protein C9374_014334 [Naegleria lovaniensis]|uniref:Carboxypeptidase n=1 Tax=Naegleria lovaniensis TaxID=51637 RepID=A0AA88GZP6_NAELO|nr:uncharacterized protein C9374_014334 [Naegleria lovaniensis]KAG2388934.1 hypothetical protein C9374_014334 [Naegleria lovaniensis]